MSYTALPSLDPREPQMLESVVVCHVCSPHFAGEIDRLETHRFHRTGSTPHGPVPSSRSEKGVYGRGPARAGPARPSQSLWWCTDRWTSTWTRLTQDLRTWDMTPWHKKEQVYTSTCTHFSRGTNDSTPGPCVPKRTHRIGDFFYRWAGRVQ